MEQYAKLSAEASLREQKALWQVRRRKLHMQRIEFLEGEERQLQQELADMIRFSYMII